MADFVKIAEIVDQFEAQIVESELIEREVPHSIVSHHDTAYDGLFQASMGWGRVEAPQEYAELILQIIEEIRSSLA